MEPLRRHSGGWVTFERGRGSDMNLPVKHYTETDIQSARQKGKVVGWFQAGAVVVVGGIVLNFLSWVPTVLVLGGVTWAGYKWMTRPSKEDGEESGPE